MRLRALLVGFILLLLTQAIGLGLFAGLLGGPYELFTNGDAMLRGAFWLVLSNVAFLVLLLAILSVRLVPLRRLERALQAVGEGDLNVELPVVRQDEIGRLAGYFNVMTGVLRKRAREQGRFVAAGELLLGVAHEVNNPLMAITAVVENRLARADLGADDRAELQEVLAQAVRAGKLLAGLIRFLRTGDQDGGPTDVEATVESAFELVAYRLPGAQVEVASTFPRELPAAAIDRSRLEQILVNLLSNALDALAEVHAPRHLDVSGRCERSRIHLSVADNGAGVAPEIANRLFHPFASTKGDRGTGMGLYFSRQIAREAGGELRYTLRKPRGSIFTLELPVVAREEPRPTAVGLGSSPGSPRELRWIQSLATLRILLVEDEATLRRPLTRFLTRRGAQVLEAENGLEALRLLERQQVDAVITDLRMPQMDGLELYAELEARHPDIVGRTLFLSGDVAQLEEAAVVVPREQVLAKPVPLAELENRVLALLRGQD